MRILLISRCSPYPIHLGDRLIVYHLAEELEARRHEIDLLAFADRPTDWDEIGRYDFRFRQVELFPEPRRSQLDYLRRMLFPPARFPRRADESWSPEMWRAIERQLAAERYDAIHLFGGVQVYEFFHALGGRPAVITPYESYSLYLRRALQALTPQPPLLEGEGENKGAARCAAVRLTTWAQWQLARGFERWMFAPYARVVVVSPPDHDELLALNPALRVEVIPNGVDTYTFRPRPTRRIPALLFVGNYEYAPNVDAALRLAADIFPRVQSQIPNVKLWLVGNAPPPELRALASDRIRVTGRVPDVRPYLARAGVFVSPLRLGAGIKNKVLEALAMGCPVAATPLSVDGIAVQDGVHARIADGEALVEAVVELLGDAALRERFAVNGRALVEGQYSWERVAAAYENLYWQING